MKRKHMRKNVRWVFVLWVMLACACACAAQTVGGGTTAASGSPGTATASPAPQSAGVDEPYTLKRGTNEFGVWGGGAFSATTVFSGLHEDEARDRKFAIAAFRYGRTLAANKSVALQYTLDAIPLAVAFGNITSATRATPDGALVTARRESTYGFGLTPLGLQLDFANGARVHPFVHVNAGGLLFTKRVPLPDDTRFVYVLEGGGGVRVFTSERRAVSLGVRLHHISNGNRAGSNRGLNQFVFYAGFSVFK
ncbi:MAG: acyloxyacyl hydrolase [Acidobacteria bacterium]|nr:acyloxyacyl hydrolase [Acidobacteriota bacterium]